MRCLLLLFVFLGGLSCAKDQPPTAPAGKSTSGDFADLFDLFDTLQEAEEDTAADSTASSAPDSSVVSPDSSIASPDSSVYSPTAAVDIPDIGLRRYLEWVLKKRRGATITHADMRAIVSLLTPQISEGRLRNIPIKSLVGLEAATNLENMAFGGDISDLTPLANLSKLRYLVLQGNEISDLTPLANLPNLHTLDLRNNQISDVSPLANLPKLHTLDLRENRPLNDVSINEHIPALRRRGVEVLLSPYNRTFPDSPFDVELVFLDDFTEAQREVLQRTARRWEAAIQADIPDFTYHSRYPVRCGDHDFTIPAGTRVDDMRIYVAKMSLNGAAGMYFYHTAENLDTGDFVDFRCMGIDPKYSLEDIWYIGLHEIGHLLGIVPDSQPHADLFSRIDRTMRHRKNPDDHFPGPQAIAAFDQAGGSDYQGLKVPKRQSSNHWHGNVLDGELMTPWGIGGALSAITLGALSDLGYTVDFSAADPYELPPPGAAKPAADAVPFCAGGMHLPVYVDD